MFLDLVPILYDIGNDSVILIDEIDRSLHTKLSQKFLEMFYENNKDNLCQLIATTHDSNLLNLDLIRQDEIWFVERDDHHQNPIKILGQTCDDSFCCLGIDVADRDAGNDDQDPQDKCSYNHDCYCALKIKFLHKITCFQIKEPGAYRAQSQRSPHKDGCVKSS